MNAFMPSSDDVLEIAPAIIPPDPLLGRLLRLRVEYPEVRLGTLATLAGCEPNKAHRLLRGWRLAQPKSEF